VHAEVIRSGSGVEPLVADGRGACETPRHSLCDELHQLVEKNVEAGAASDRLGWSLSNLGGYYSKSCGLS
jgi:hypothetical protein